MRLARLSLAAAALIALAACSNDATAPTSVSPSAQPQLSQFFGSGNRAGADSVTAGVTAGTVSMSTDTASII